MKNFPLTEQELADADKIRTAADHRAYCDKLKAARDGNYPCDWGEKMLNTGKNDEIASRYDVSGFKVTQFRTIEELFASIRAPDYDVDEIYDELTDLSDSYLDLTATRTAKPK